MNAIDDRFKVKRADGYGLMRNVGKDGAVWFHGIVRTPLGYVYVYAEKGVAQLSIIRDGYEVRRTFRKTYQQRSLVMLAHKFVKEQSA